MGEVRMLWMTIGFAWGSPAIAPCPSGDPLALTGERRARAATCLLERHPSTAAERERALDAVEVWMTDPKAADLAQLVVDRLETLPEDLAVAAASTGVRGPHARMVYPAVWSSGRAKVRAVLSVDEGLGDAGGL